MHVRAIILFCLSCTIVQGWGVTNAVADPTDWSRAALQSEAEGRYTDALAFYERILVQAPNSSAARTAMARKADLSHYSDYDFVPYRKFSVLRREYVSLGSDRAVDKARSILEEYPHATVAPEIRLWLGNEFRETRQDHAAAIQEYRRLIEDYGNHRLARIAYDRMGGIYEAEGNFAAARGVYAELQREHPEASTPERYELRRQSLVRQAGHRFAYHGSLATLGLAVFLLPFLGVFRGSVRDWLRGSLPKAGFSLLVGLVPAAILSVVGEMWSPSLTVMGLSFAGYAFVLGALQARQAVRSRWSRRFERVLYGALVPLAILCVIVHHFQLWEAFWI